MSAKALRCMAALLVVSSEVFSANVVLNVPQVFQEQNEWCWAGTSAAVLGYYGKTVRQCEIANFTRQAATWHDFGKDDCCTNPSGACNYWNYNYGYPGSISDILRKWAVPNRFVGTPLSLQDVGKELEAKRPFILRWALKPSGGHFVVGYGLSDSTLHYMDPWKGEGAKMAKYSWVVSNKDKSWGETNLMTSAPTGVSVHAPREVVLGGRMRQGSLVVNYTLPHASGVELALRALDGRLLRSRTLGIEAAGSHEAWFDATALPTGGCVLQLRADDIELSTKVIVQH